jgi:hypothetical protein
MKLTFELSGGEKIALSPPQAGVRSGGGQRKKRAPGSARRDVLISLRPIGHVHLGVRLCQFLRPCFALNAVHAALNRALASSIDASRPERRAGNADGDVPKPTAGRALARKADAADGLAVFVDGVIVGVNEAECEH